MPSTDRCRAMLAGFALALCTAIAPGPAAEAQTTATVRILESGAPNSAIFIGNSFFYYNNGITGHLNGLARAADADSRLRTTMVTISGAGINWHDVESYFRPDAIGSYSFTQANEIVFNRPNKLFDVAVIMDCSQCPIHPKLQHTFKIFARKNSDSIRKNGAEPVFFMSWAYADKPDMTAQLAEQYTLAGNEHRALVIPAGLAFARAVAKRPEVNLYVADKRHPSLAGTYLAACATYAALFGKSPEGLGYTAGLDAQTAAFLQSIAWETEQAYHGK
jgi:hypothetical protein